MSAIYSQCPDCGKAYPLTKKQQRAKKAQIYCGDCKKKFAVTQMMAEKNVEAKNLKPKKAEPKIQKTSASHVRPILLAEAEAKYVPKEESNPLTGLNVKTEFQPYLKNIGAILRKSDVKATQVVAQSPAPEGERLPWERETKIQYNINWFLGVMIGFLLLLGQTVYFEGPKASQHAKYRPWVEKLCDWFGCKLAGYENLSEFTVLQSSFTTQPDHTIVFKTAINNQASFQQKLPNIQLNLLDYNEQLIAQRIFYPKEYLINSQRAMPTITPDETVEARLHIMQPETPVGGYNFNLVY